MQAFDAATIYSVGFILLWNPSKVRLWPCLTLFLEQNFGNLKKLTFCKMVQI